MRYTQLLLLAIFSFTGQSILQCAQARSEAKQDHYAILGVPRNAPLAVIKSAWKQKALQYHPDRNQGDNVDDDTKKIANDEMVRINAAYGVLADPEKRRAYDLGGDEEVEHAEKRSNNSNQSNDDYTDDYSNNHYRIDLTNPKMTQCWKNTILRSPGIDMEAEDFLSKKTLQELRAENKDKSLILALVPVLKEYHSNVLCGFHTYEAQRFNAFICDDKGDIYQKGPQGEDLRQADNITCRSWETCFIQLEPGKKTFTYLCSWPELIEQSEAGEKLRQLFKNNGNGTSNYTEVLPNISCAETSLLNGEAKLFKQPTLKPRLSKYAKELLITACISFFHGLINNKLGRTYNDPNTYFLKAPWREWGTAALALFLRRKLSDEIFGTRVFNSGNFLNYSSLFYSVNAGAQMLGEVIPFPHASGFRTVAPNFNTALAVGYTALWALWR